MPVPRATPDRLLAGLNERQLQAVTMPEVDGIILAGAGSGKTSVLTKRAAWLMREGKATSNEIMAVTFTNKAAKEMKTRLGHLVDDPVRNMWLGTFHGLCRRMLTENVRLAGLPGGFSILDQDDQLMMIRRIVKEAGTLPDDMKPNDYQTYINKWKEKGMRPRDIVPEHSAQESALAVYAMYEAQCAKEGTVDFSELLLRVNELFRTNGDFLMQYQDRFRHILVDEFQDTNGMQYEWLMAVRGKTSKLFGVGDDDQAIYGFRGSNPENMMSFVQEVAGGNIIRLEQNYRSTGNILKAANALIAKNEGRLGKDLWTATGDGERLQVMSFDDDRDESERVGITIKGMLNGGTDPSDVAILYRSNNQSRAYERALLARGVPYVIHGGTKFFERMEVENVLAYMKLAFNVDDDTSFLRVVNFPPRGIGDVTVNGLIELAKAQEVSLLCACAEHYVGKAKERFDQFIAVLLDCFEASTRLNLPEYVAFVLEATGLTEVYGKKEDDKDRLNNIKELLTAATRFCEELEGGDGLQRRASVLMSEFLASASLESAVDVAKDVDNPAGVADKKAVTLMTVHSAKGLEFDNVVIGGAEEGTFPSTRSLDEGNLDEERRLMYVAITRARRSLIITHAKQRMVFGKVMDTMPSQFLGEIPGDFVEALNFCTPEESDDEQLDADYQEAFDTAPQPAARDLGGARSNDRRRLPAPMPSPHRSAFGRR